MPTTCPPPGPLPLGGGVNGYLKTNTGRQRLNILGAYNPDNQRFIHITGEENCDANRVIEYFEMIIGTYSQAPKIILFLDNARYFKAKIVSDWLEEHPKLHIEFLPAYAPNLNLIERLWKFVKKKCLYSKYYPDFSAFKAAINGCLEQTSTTHRTELKSLLSLRFQLFEKTQFSPV